MSNSSNHYFPGSSSAPPSQGYSQLTDSSQRPGVSAIFDGYTPTPQPRSLGQRFQPSPVVPPLVSGNKRGAESSFQLGTNPTISRPTASVSVEEQISLSTSGAGMSLMPLPYQSALQSLRVHWVTEVFVLAEGVSDTREANMGIGSLFLAQTYPWRGQPWNAEDQACMNWAVCRVEGIEYGNGVFYFYVAKYLNPYGANGLDRLFSRLDEVYSSTSLAQEMCVLRTPVEDQHRRLLGMAPKGDVKSPRLSDQEYARFVATSEQAQTRKPNLNPGTTSFSDVLFDSPPHEGQSYSSKDDFKIVYDYQGNQHTLRSMYAVKFLSFMNLYYRIMEDKKRDVIIRADTAYDRESWDGAMDLFRLGEADPGMDGPTATLYECYKLDNMPVTLNLEKLDRARLCLWKARDLTWLSIVDFHEAPHAVQDSIKGTDRATRMYLSGCVKGYLAFLRVYFFSQADLLLLRLIAWLEKPDSPYTKPVNVEFVRCRIDRMFVDMWTEVRSSFNGSSRFPGVCDFQRPGAVWLLMARYEQSLFEQISLDEYPHQRFYEKPRGEYYSIRGAGLLEAPAAHSVTPPSRSAYSNSGGTPTSLPGHLVTPLRTTGGKVMVICPYHLARQLQVARNDGTLMSECSYLANCRFPHVDIATLTTAQAIGSLHNCKPSMVAKVTAAVTLRGAEFKA